MTTSTNLRVVRLKGRYRRVRSTRSLAISSKQQQHAIQNENNKNASEQSATRKTKKIIESAKDKQCRENVSSVSASHVPVNEIALSATRLAPG